MDRPTGPIVWVVNQSGHDFSKAEQYGELRFMSKGFIDPLSVAKMFRIIAKALTYSQADDYLLVSGLTVMNMLAAACIAYKHQRVNLLVFIGGRYHKRTIVLTELLEKEPEE